MSDQHRPAARGRGSSLEPPNRFGGPRVEVDPDALDDDPELVEALADPRTTYLPDRSRGVVTENDSPDVGFRYSINPYRGCQHGCSYCYARPTHEYLGLNAGIDFETRIFVKEDAPALLREFLGRRGWVPEPIALSGVTDPYQPAERNYRLARGCLEVALAARQPVWIVTKNALVVRDLDRLSEMAARRLVHVNLSVTTLDPKLARSMEPRTSTPAARLRAIRALREAGVPVRVLMAPIIPGLNDAEIPAILEAVRDAGAQHAEYVLLRLPMTVEPVFREWLEREQPGRAERVEGRVRAARGGRLNDSTFGRRMTGTGELAGRIRDLFKLFRARHGLDRDLPPVDVSAFRPPREAGGQMWLFD